MKERCSSPDLTDAAIDFKIILFKYFYWQVVKMNDNDFNSKLKILHKARREKNQACIDFWAESVWSGRAG